MAVRSSPLDFPPGPADPASGHTGAHVSLGRRLPTGSSVITNITVTDEATNGFITAYPSGTPNPGTSNLNYAKNQTLAGLSILKATGTDNEITVDNQSNGTSDIVLDVFGYFASS